MIKIDEFVNYFEQCQTYGLRMEAGVKFSVLWGWNFFWGGFGDLGINVVYLL
jgi:hypothetical protein